MSRKSTISRLPLPVRKAIDDALKTGRFTLDEILADIREQFGEKLTPSRSSLGRYSQRFEDVGKRMRESREVAQVWVDRLGNEPQGDIGKLVMEMLRTMAFDATLEMSEGEMQVTPKALNALALAMHRLETASRHNLEREKAMRKAALEEAAKSVESAARKKGISADTADWIRREILGINSVQPPATTP